MAKLLLLSVIFATILLPARAARMKNAKLGFRRTVISLAVFNLFWVLGLAFLYGHLL